MWVAGAVFPASDSVSAWFLARYGRPARAHQPAHSPTRKRAVHTRYCGPYSGFGLPATGLLQFCTPALFLVGAGLSRLPRDFQGRLLCLRQHASSGPAFRGAARRRLSHLQRPCGGVVRLRKFFKPTSLQPAHPRSLLAMKYGLFLPSPRRRVARQAAGLWVPDFHRPARGFGPGSDCIRVAFAARSGGRRSLGRRPTSRACGRCRPWIIRLLIHAASS